MPRSSAAVAAGFPMAVAFSLLLHQLPVLGRRHAERPLENDTEMRLIRKPADRRDLCDRQSRPFQQFPSSTDALRHYVLMRGLLK